MRRCASVVCSASLLASLASFSLAGETPARFRTKSFAEVMSPGTLFYLEVPDKARAREAYRRTPRWKLWWEGAGRRLIEASIRSMEDEELSAAMRALAESPKLIQGKLAFAMELPAGEDMDMPGTVLLAEAGGRAPELAKLLGNMMGGGFVERRERVLGGVRFAEMDGLLLGRTGGLVIAGVGRPTVGGLLARFDERPWQNLSASRAYRMARERVGADAHFFGFVNFGDLWKFARMEAMDEELAALTRSGLTQLTATGFGGRFTPGGVVDRLTFILSGRARGMWKLLEPKPLSRATWKGLPDFTSGFVTARLPLVERAKPFMDLMRVVDDMTAEDLTDTFAELREETGVSFKKDILPLATGEVSLVFLDEPEGGMLHDPGTEKFARLTMLAVELTDAAKARSVMDRIARRDFSEKKRFGDLQGWVIDLGFFEEYCVIGRDGIAYIALSGEPLERLARHFAKGGARLVDSAEFRKATAWIPKDTGFVGYSSLRKLLKSVHGLLTTELEEEEARRLPPAEALMADLTPLTAALKVEKPGFTFEVHSPDGFWAFYMQLAAHIIQREEEAMAAATTARTRPVEAYIAQYETLLTQRGDADAAKAFGELRVKLAEIKDPKLKMAVLKRALKSFADAEHVKVIEAFIMRLQQNMAHEREMRMQAEFEKLFEKLMVGVMKLKAPEDRIRALEVGRAELAGSVYESHIKRLIDREKKMQAVARGGKLVITGKVLAVRPEVGLVMLSVGKDELVEQGMTFLIDLDGRFAGRVRVEKVFDDMCSAKIVQEFEGRKIREGLDARLESRPSRPARPARRKAVQEAPRAGKAAVAGKVLAVRPEVKLVMLSVGRDDGVAAGLVFGVYRGGRRVGRVRVEKVFADMCSAKIVEELGGQGIREGDDVRLESTAGGESEEPGAAEDFF